MAKADPQMLWNEANILLLAAEKEVNRAEEDMVTHLVCMNSRQSIINYLKGYLLDNGIDPIEPNTMASLLNQCMGIDDKFSKLDLSPINCRFEVGHEDYCLEIEKVSECIEVAQLAKSLAVS